MAVIKEDMYSDGAETAAPEEVPTPEAQAEEGAQETALIPKSILAGKTVEVGDQVILKVVRIHDGEVEVSYATEGESEAEGEEEGMHMMPTGEMMPDSEMGGMYE